jgi:hypothetical protein
MEDQAPQGPSQGLSESQAVELLKQRRAAAKAAPTTPAPAAAPVEPTQANAEEPSASDEEGSPAAEGEPAQSEETNAEPHDEEPVIDYVVDGKPAKASLQEAKDALASVKHLSRLRNEIVENHKTVNTQVQEVQTQRQQLVGQLQEVEQLLMSGLPNAQQMQQMLDVGDSAAYLKAQQAHQRYAQVKGYREQQDQQAKEQDAAYRKQREAVEAQELVKMQPEFAKPDYAKKVYAFLREDNGYGEEEIAGFGARELVLADEARKYREWNRNKTLGLKKAIATAANPSKAPPPQPANERQLMELRNKLKQSGSQNDAIMLLKMKRQQAMRS